MLPLYPVCTPTHRSAALLTLACSDATGPATPTGSITPCVAAIVNGSSWGDSDFTPGAAATRAPDSLFAQALRRRANEDIGAINIQLIGFTGSGTYALGDSAAGSYGEFGVQPSGSDTATFLPYLSS